MGMVKEFREFATKGNVVDLAVGIIIGGSFGKVVTSMVNDLMMPPIGKIMANVNFMDLFINLDPSKTLANGEKITSMAQAKEAGIAAIAYGQFINTVLDFVIVAACMFLLVKGMNAMRKKAEPAPAATQECPHCLMTIPVKATRCGHCTSQV